MEWTCLVTDTKFYVNTTMCPAWFVNMLPLPDTENVSFSDLEAKVAGGENER